MVNLLAMYTTSFEAEDEPCEEFAIKSGQPIYWNRTYASLDCKPAIETIAEAHKHNCKKIQFPPKAKKSWYHFVLKFGKIGKKLRTSKSGVVAGNAGASEIVDSSDSEYEEDEAFTDRFRHFDEKASYLKHYH